MILLVFITAGLQPNKQYKDLYKTQQKKYFSAAVKSFSDYILRKENLNHKLKCKHSCTPSADSCACCATMRLQEKTCQHLILHFCSCAQSHSWQHVSDVSPVCHRSQDSRREENKTAVQSNLQSIKVSLDSKSIAKTPTSSLDVQFYNYSSPLRCS